MRITISFIAIAVSLSGCLTFSSFQSAPILEPGEQRFTFAASRASFESNENGTGTVWPGHSAWTVSGTNTELWKNFEFLARSGTGNERLDLGLSAAFLTRDGDHESTTVRLDGRVGLIEDLLTFQLPWAVGLGASSATKTQYELAPTLVATFPLSGLFELNGTAAYRHETTADLNAVSATLGLAIPLPGGRVRLRPEVGWFDPGNSDGYRQVGIGVEFRTLKEDSEPEVESNPPSDIFG